jgi:hypothetical protein
METNTTTTATTIATIMNEWDKQIEIAINKGNTHAEAVATVTEMFNQFFTK